MDRIGYRGLKRLGALGATLLIGVAGCHKEKTPDPLANMNLGPAPKPQVGTPLPPQPQLTDPAKILRQMAANYRSLDSFQSSSTAVANARFSGNTEMNQVNVMQWRKSPGGVHLKTQDNVGGTLDYVGSEGRVTSYIGKYNNYSRLSCNSDLTSTAATVARVSGQVFSPLTVVAGADPLACLQGLKYAGTEKIAPDADKPNETVDTVVIKGRFTPQYTTAMAQQIWRVPLKQQSSEVTLWLDRDTYLIRRSVGRAAWTGLIKPRNGKALQVQPEISFSETATDIAVNPKLSDDVFRFSPPKNSKEVFPTGGQ